MGRYGLAVLLVAIAATLRWALADVLSPAPILVFCPAWMAAAAFGGLGPGLLATLASWLCMAFLFDPAPGFPGFDDSSSIIRLSLYLAGGLGAGMMGERMRRARIHERRRGREVKLLTDANAALRASEKKYRFLVENSKDVTWVIDLQGKWTFISSNVERVSGYRADEVIGRTLWDFLAPECHDLVREKLARRVRGEDLPPYEVTVVHKDGSRIPFELLAVSVIDEGGNIVGVQGVSRDIMERKRAEAALLENEQRYRGIVEDQTELICLFESDGTITFVNDAYCRYFGKKREELVGRNLFPLITEEDRESVRARIAAIGPENPLVTVEQRVHRADGSLAWQEWKHRAVFDAQGRRTGCQAVGRDITERKRAEEALRDLNATLESKVAQRTAELEDRTRQLQKLTLDLTETESRERKRLAEILHDDLQQTLAAAKFHLGIVSSRCKDDVISQETTEQVKHMLAEAIGKSRSLSHELSPPGLAHSDLRETFEWLASQMQIKHGLTVRVEVGDRIVLQSEPLRVLLFKAAQEMLFNVVKHAQVREARLQLRRWRGNICLAVSDMGCGFDPHETGESAGFGLLSLRERIDLLGGDMKIRSVKGRGSTFLISVRETPA